MKRGSAAIGIFAELPLILVEGLFGEVKAYEVFKTGTSIIERP